MYVQTILLIYEYLNNGKKEIGDIFRQFLIVKTLVW